MTVAIDVDENGTPSGCQVTVSSGDADLDSLTCSLLQKRAEFKPATDRTGQAIRSVYSQKVSWRIPREKLITQGFKLTFAVEPNGRLSSCQMVKYDFQDNDLQCNPQMIDLRQFTENIIRVIPDGLGLSIDASRWQLPPVFQWLQREGQVADEEMWRTFNCGIGFVLVAPQDAAAALEGELDRLELSHWRIGEVTRAGDGERVRIG